MIPSTISTLENEKNKNDITENQKKIIDDNNSTTKEDIK